MSNNVQIGAQELGAVADSEEDNPEEFIGFLKFSTTGEALVPREWLIDQWEKHSLPEDILPREITNWQAYRRTIRALEDDGDLLSYSIYNDHYGREFNCHFNIEKSGSEGNNVFIVYARTFMPEEICGQEGGDYSVQRVGYFNFHRPEDGGEGYMIHESEIDDSNAHYEPLENLFDESREVMRTMESHHNLNDLNSILEDYRTFETEAVEIRRAVYFIPAHHENTLNALSDIWMKMNQYKERGEEMRIDKTPVVNMKEQRELVASRVREKVQGMVSEIVGEIVNEFEDNNEQTADAAARELMNELEDSQDISSTYNQLLNMKLSVQEVLEEQREELSDEADEIIENVINQKTFDEL